LAHEKLHDLLGPKLNFFAVYGRLVIIYGCFSAKPENCGERMLRLKLITAVYEIYGCFPAEPENIKEKYNSLKIPLVAQ